MTNFQYLLEKYGVEFIKKLIARDLGVNRLNNEPCSCRDLKCLECRFCNTDCQSSEKLSWLDSQRMPLYKEGDIVLVYNSDKIFIIDHTSCYSSKVRLVNQLKEPCATYVCDISDIQRKVGSINE